MVYVWKNQRSGADVGFTGRKCNHWAEKKQERVKDTPDPGGWLPQSPGLVAWTKIKPKHSPSSCRLTWRLSFIWSHFSFDESLIVVKTGLVWGHTAERISERNPLNKPPDIFLPFYGPDLLSSSQLEAVKSNLDLVTCWEFSALVSAEINSCPAGCSRLLELQGKLFKINLFLFH